MRFFQQNWSRKCLFQAWSLTSHSAVSLNAHVSCVFLNWQLYQEVITGLSASENARWMMLTSSFNHSKAVKSQYLRFFLSGDKGTVQHLLRREAETGSENTTSLAECKSKTTINILLFLFHRGVIIENKTTLFFCAFTVN